jgi:hypothetical protein
MVNFVSNFLSLLRYVFSNQLKDRIELNERIISALFHELVITKKLLGETVLRPDMTPEGKQELWVSIKEGIYKKILESVDYDYAIDVNDFKRGCFKIKCLSGKSKISFLNELIEQANVEIKEYEEAVKKNREKT